MSPHNDVLDSDNFQKTKPLLCNILQYTVSANEYQNIHYYIFSCYPPLVNIAPSVLSYKAFVRASGGYNAAIIRAALRVFAVCQTALSAWELVRGFLSARKVSKSLAFKAPKASFFFSANFRLSLSASLILLFHRLLYRFFQRLRKQLLSADGKQFGRRNPRLFTPLTSQKTPAIGASLAGFLLVIYPSNQFRITAAIFAFTRALESLYNLLSQNRQFYDKPWWLGSWLLMPPVFGQLLHAFMFNRDCFPKAYGDFILNHTPNYIQRRPEVLSTSLPWPETYEIIDSLALIAQLNHPPFVSSILFPASKPLPDSLLVIAPIVNCAHPSIKSLSCALLHPNDPSCLRSYLTFYIRAFPSIARFFAPVFTALTLTKYRAFLKSPIKVSGQLIRSIVRMAMFISGSIGTSWGAICLFQLLFPPTFLPTQRYFLGGALGGLWSILVRKQGKSSFLYSTRLSIASFWKVAVKQGWVKGIKNGDILLFVTSLAVINTVFERSPTAIDSAWIRRSLEFLKKPKESEDV